MVGEGEGEMYGESNMETYITICKVDSQWEFSVTQGTQRGSLYQPRAVGWGGRWEGDSEGGYICIPMTDSCWCLTENNKIL